MNLRSFKTNKTVVFLTFLLLALILHFFYFDNLPPSNGLGFEEEETGWIAYRMIHPRGIQVITLSHLITNGLAAFSFKFLGASIITLRIPFIVIGSLSVPVLYLLLSELVSQVPAITSTFLFLIARWHIFGSRTADELFTGIVLELFLLLFLVKTIKHNNFIYYFFTGIFLGCITYEYMGYRISVPFTLFAIFINLSKQIIRKQYCTILKVILFVGVFLLIISPLISSSMKGDDFLIEGFRRHSNEKLGGGMKPMFYLLQNSLVQILPDTNIIKSRFVSLVDVLFLKESRIDELGPTLPLFDVITRSLLLLSLLYVASRIKRKLYLFLLLWFVISIFFGMFFPINFYPGRLFPVLVFCYIFICFFLEYVNKLSNKTIMKKLYYMFSFVIIVISFLLNNINFKKQLNDKIFQNKYDFKHIQPECNQENKTWICSKYIKRI